MAACAVCTFVNEKSDAACAMCGSGGETAPTPLPCPTCTYAGSLVGSRTCEVCGSDLHGRPAAFGAAFQECAEVLDCAVSQFSFEGGSSSCTVIACEAGLALLGGAASTPESMATWVESGVRSHGSLGVAGGIEHTTAGEVLPRIPSLAALRVLGVPLQGMLTNPQWFESMIEQVHATANPSKMVGLVLTKPPESILVVLPSRTPPEAGYIIFDSHARAHLGRDGAYALRCSTAGAAAAALREIFPVVDLGGDEDFQSSIYSMIEGTSFQLG